VPTAEGQVFFDGCRGIVARYEALEDEVRALHAEVAGQVRVAAIYSVGLHHMSRSLKQFMSHYPKANVRLEYLHPQRVLETVENGQADIGLVSYPRSTRAIQAEPWRDEPMVLVCAPGHAFTDRLRIEPSELDGCPLVGFDPDLVIRHEIDRALAAEGVEPRVVMEFDNIETIKRAVEIDAGVAILPEPTVSRELAAGMLVAVPLAVGEAFVRQLPKTTLKSYISGKNSDMYVYSGTFTPNDKLVDTWVWAVWPNPKHPGEIDEKINSWLKNKLDNLPIKLEKPKDTLQLQDGGKVSKSRFFRGYFWSDDMLIGIDNGIAQKMELRTYHGVDFLIVEGGGFGAVSPDDEGTEPVPADYHPGYSVYIRKVE